MALARNNFEKEIMINAGRHINEEFDHNKANTTPDYTDDTAITD